MKMVTTDNVNLRRGPELTAQRLHTLPASTTVTFADGTAQADGHEWARVETVINGTRVRGWVSRRFLRNAPVTPAKSIGLHVAYDGHEGDLIGAAQRLHIAGRPIPLILVVSDPGLVSRIKNVSPSTTVVYRWVFGSADPGPFGTHENGDGWADPDQWFDELWRRHSQAQAADFHQLYNEASFGGNTQSEAYAARVATFEMGLMRRAEREGAKITIGNYMPGVPERHHVDMMARTFAYAEENGHALCYHAYTTADPRADTEFRADAQYFALRWVNWVEPYPRLKIILGEAGLYNSPRFRGVPTLLKGMSDLDDLLKPYRAAGRDVTAAYWTIRGQTSPLWGVDDFTPYLSEYEAWMKED